MYRIYTVREEEDLLSITNRLGITPDEIRRINGLPENYEVAPGEQLIVPTVTASPFDNYVIKKGDTLYAIAKQYNISSNEIARLNGLDPDEYLYPDQQLLVPREGVTFYITDEGDTVDMIRQQFPNDYEKIFRTNQYIYLMPDQVLVFRKNNQEMN